MEFTAICYSRRVAGFAANRWPTESPNASKSKDPFPEIDRRFRILAFNQQELVLLGTGDATLAATISCYRHIFHSWLAYLDIYKKFNVRLAMLSVILS